MNLDFCSIQRIGSRMGFAALILLGALSAQAQFGIQVGQLGDMAWSQRFQPAHIAGGEFTKFRYAGYGEGWFGNTDASVAGVFAENGYISEATKQRVLDDISGDLQITGGYQLNLADVNVKLGATTLAFSLNTGLNLNAHIDSANTLGLLLRGNKPYAGMTVGESGIWANMTQTRTLGIGAGWSFDKLKIGGRLNLIQGVRAIDLSESSYSLFTDADGIQVTLNADYDLFATGERNGFFDFKGFGASLDVGASYAINEKLQLDAAVTGAGFTQWNGSQVADVVSVNWEGISITSLLQDSLPLEIQEQVDSIKALIFPDTVPAKLSQLTPLTVRLGGTYQLSENGVLGLVIVYAPLNSGPKTPMPLFALSYRHEIIDGLVLGGSAYYGSYDAFGFGAMGKYSIPAGSLKINLLAGSDNLLGFIASNVGRGFSAYGGVGVDF